MGLFKNTAKLARLVQPNAPHCDWQGSRKTRECCSLWLAHFSPHLRVSSVNYLLFFCVFVPGSPTFVVLPVSFLLFWSSDGVSESRGRLSSLADLSQMMVFTAEPWHYTHTHKNEECWWDRASATCLSTSAVMSGAYQIYRWGLSGGKGGGGEFWEWIHKEVRFTQKNNYSH